MKKKVILLIILICFVSVSFVLLNVKVTTRQGINYVVSTKKIPLYLKTLGYFYRHFAYKQLVSEIIKDARTDKDKILTIFKWTHENIKQNIPEDYPIVDDHVLNIIIRHYGVHDQSQDVFTTLCTYAGFRAFWFFIEGENIRPRHITISLVQLNGRWLVFDSFRGNYFLNSKGEIASVEDIRNDLLICSQPVNIATIITPIDYSKFLVNLRPEDISITRAESQIPAKRIAYEMERLFKRK